MKRGRTLEELGRELERQRRARKDFVADTRKLTFQMKGTAPTLCIEQKDGLKPYPLNDLAQQQLASRLQIPFRYYQKMQNEYPALLENNVNGWFHRTPERRIIRVLDGHVRAFLSDRYRRLDHLELCTAVLPIIREMKDAEIKSCEVTEEHMYIKVINRAMQDEITVGDTVQAGFVISNSEVGLGSVRVEPLIYRLVCKNGLIVQDYSQKKYHVGRQVEMSDTAYELYSDETLKQDDKAFFMKVRDTVRAAADKAKFELLVNKMRQAMDIPLSRSVPDEVKVLSDKFQLTEGERQQIMNELFCSGDHTRYGLLNAVTAAGRTSDTYERATYLERVGGNILSTLPTVTDSGAKIIMPRAVIPFREAQ